MKTKILVRVFLAIAGLIIIFGSLEMCARYKYYGGSLREKGFRARGKKYTAKKQTPYRIVCAGNAFTSGIKCPRKGSNESSETYPFYLEQIINKKIGKNFAEVINSGIQGIYTEQLRDYIKERVDDNNQELDMVIFWSMERYIPSHRRKIIFHWENIASPGISSFLVDHSFFYTRLVEKISKILKKDANAYYISRSKQAKKRFVEIIEDTYKIETEDERTKFLAIYVDRYSRAIEDIIGSLKSRNIDIVLIIPPRFYRYPDNIFETGRQCLIRLGKKHDLLVIDTDKKFAKLEKIGRGLFCDGAHLNPKGNYFAADVIAKKLVPYLKDKKNLPT